MKSPFQKGLQWIWNKAPCLEAISLLCSNDLKHTNEKEKLKNLTKLLPDQVAHKWIISSKSNLFSSSKNAQKISVKNNSVEIPSTIIYFNLK